MLNWSTYKAFGRVTFIKNKIQMHLILCVQLTKVTVLFENSIFPPSLRHILSLQQLCIISQVDNNLSSLLKSY